MLNGPVVHYSALKFERQNRRLKLVAVGTTSNVNLPITISIRHQLQICFSAEFSKSHLQADVVPGPCKELNAFSKLKALVAEVDDSLNVRKLKNVKILGKIFSQGTILVIKITGEGTTFGKLKDIFHCNDTHVYLQIEEFDTLYFNNFYHAYCVSSGVCKPEIIMSVDMLPKLPACLYIVIKGEEFIATRYDFWDGKLSVHLYNNCLSI